MRDKIDVKKLHAKLVTFVSLLVCPAKYVEGAVVTFVGLYDPISNYLLTVQRISDR